VIVRVALVALLVVLAGCAAPANTDAPADGSAPPTTAAPSDGTEGSGAGSDGDGTTTDQSTPAEPAPLPAGWEHPEDPPSDRLGWEGGYWHNESVAVDQSDGLNDTELAAFVNRTVARVEVVRGLEFVEPVPVEVVSRADYRNDSAFGGADNETARAWNDQVWEALLLVGEDREVADVFDDLYDGAVQGYYSPSEGRIVIVSDSPRPSIDRGTLAHELVHALQDQRFGLPESGDTQDRQLARNGLVEGDARYVEHLYRDECAAGNWTCVPNPPVTGGGSAVDQGVFLVVYAPYSEGPTFVHALRERGGWDAVNDAYADPPTSTEQVLHPDAYPAERPVDVTVPDRSTGDWSRFDHEPIADTVGEASLFVAFQQRGGIDPETLRRNTGPYSPYNYASKVTAGWAGDAVVPYRSEGGEFGYVFRIEWDTVADAEAFERRYSRIILGTRLNANRTRSDTWVVESGPFADAFRITRDGRTVTIVNAPTADALDRVHQRE